MLLIAVIMIWEIIFKMEGLFSVGERDWKPNLPLRMMVWGEWHFHYNKALCVLQKNQGIVLSSCPSSLAFNNDSQFLDQGNCWVQSVYSLLLQMLPCLCFSWSKTNHPIGLDLILLTQCSPFWPPAASGNLTPPNNFSSTHWTHRKS